MKTTMTGDGRFRRAHERPRGSGSGSTARGIRGQHVPQRLRCQQQLARKACMSHVISCVDGTARINSGHKQMQTFEKIESKFSPNVFFFAFAPHVSCRVNYLYCLFDYTCQLTSFHSESDYNTRPPFALLSLASLALHTMSPCLALPCPGLGLVWVWVLSVGSWVFDT